MTRGYWHSQAGIARVQEKTKVGEAHFDQGNVDSSEKYTKYAGPAAIKRAEIQILHAIILPDLLGSTREQQGDE